MPDDEDHTVADQLLGGGDRLLGIAEVVRRDEPHLLAEHAARRIDVGHGHLRAALHLLAGPGERSGDRACGPDQHLRLRRPAGGRYKRDHCCGDNAVHGYTPKPFYANPVGVDSSFRGRGYCNLVLLPGRGAPKYVKY